MTPTPLPLALAGIVRIPQFFIWRLTWDDEQGKHVKHPCEPGLPGKIDAQLPHNWLTYETAMQRLQWHRDNETVPGRLFTLGWMFTADCGYWFLDLDSCIDAAGNYSEVARDWIGRFPGCFWEFSCSGKGVHIVGRGHVPPHRTRNKDTNTEFYTQHRGIAFGLTGLAFGNADTVAPQIADHAARYFEPRAAGAAGEFGAPRADWQGPTDDAELLRRAMASSSAVAKFGGKATFAHLWTNAPELNTFYCDGEGKPALTERDFALASHLAFWTGCDAPRIERLMRQSGLVRAKWDDHRTYLAELTIGNACAQTTNVLKDRPRVDVNAAMYGPGAPPSNTQVHGHERPAVLAALPKLPAVTPPVPPVVATGSLPPLPIAMPVPGAAALPALPVVAPVIPAATVALVESLLSMVSASADWAEVHNNVIPAIRAAGVPPALMPRLENAVNKRLELWDAKLPVAKLRALLDPPRVATTDDPAEVDKPEWAGHFVYVQQSDGFYDLRDATTVTRTTFGAMYDRFMPIKGDGPMRQSSVDYMLQHWACPVVFDTMYWPGAGAVFTYEGRQWANLYSAASLPVAPAGYDAETVAQIERFKLHLYLICGKRDRVYLTMLAWMAHNVQKPGVKIRWAPLIKGIPGDGKSTIAQVMNAALGPRNCFFVGPDIVGNSGGFTDWAHGHAFVALEELYMVGRERYKIYNMIKPQITNNINTINVKGGKPKKVMNTCNQLAFTNHNDAIPIEASNDRRWLVIFTPFGSREQLYAALGVLEGRHHFDPLYASLAAQPGQWAKWLREYAIPDWFDIDGAALDTDEKAVMSDSGTDDVEMLVRDIMATGAVGVSETCLSSACLSNAMKQLAFTSGVDIPKGSSMHHMLNRIGMVRISKQIKWDGAPHRVWVRVGVNTDDNDAIRQLLDATKTAKLQQLAGGIAMPPA